jgi:cell pole-organizing protein PopZ
MSSPQHEPTMEEILASIRKIISEDTPEAAPAAEAPAASPPPAAAKQELLSEPEHSAEIEVLELTQEIVETPAPRPEPVHTPEPAKPDDIVFEPAPARQSDEGIFSDHTRKAMDDAFSSLDHADEPAPAPRAAAAPAAPSAAGSSVESVFERAVRESFEPVLEQYLSDNSAAVLERMKPLIREWMDEHFPALLEGAVRNEIERVVRARGRH